VVPVRRRVLLAAWGFLCLGPRTLSAQDAPHRPALNQLRSALDSATTIPEVDHVAAGWDAVSRKPVERLGDAYIELRRGVLLDDRATLVSAWDDFDRVVRLHPDWPYARLGLAVAALEIYSRRYPLPASYDDVAGGTHYDGYSIQMNRALHSEPTFQPAINWLAGTLSTALTTLRTQASSLGSQLSVVQTRQDFTKAMVNTLQIGADNLVLADTNEEGANMLALQTRQSLSTTALSLASQADQNVLRLFG